MKLFYRTNCRMTLLQIVALLVIIGTLLYLNKDLITQYYLLDNEIQEGIWLNGIILLLFFTGLMRIILTLLRYLREQHIIQHFIPRLEKKLADPIEKLSTKSLIIRRYQAIDLLAKQKAAINQGALAATVTANENTKLTLIRFVNNTLILAGVFGTIVSLSIALLGASSLLATPESTQKMSIVIGGMSTALSTTLTAIVCYIFYAYFYLRLNAAKTHLLTNIEEVTTLYILPKFIPTEEKIQYNMQELTSDLRQASNTITEVQSRFIDAGEGLQLAVNDLHQHVLEVNQDMQDIKMIIKQGFRLPLDNESK